MADDAEDDYMADLSRFIPTEAAPPVRRRNGKASTDVEGSFPWKEKRKTQRLQVKLAEEEQRNDGLGSAIPSTNIGFKMLQQMGYTPGLALGKHGQGLLEPVNIDLKRSRTGLGRDNVCKEDELAKERRTEIERARKRQKETALRADFQDRRRDSWHGRKIVSDYRKACATLLQLEESSFNSENVEHLTGPSKDSTTKEDAIAPGGVEDAAEEEEEEITSEMLHAVLQKLRIQYNYCLYCGCKYDSPEALLLNCPGLEDEDH